MNMRTAFLPAALGALLAFTATMPSPLRADDTDLYVHPNFSGASDALPVIMFTLDYRTNLGSTVCTNPALASCSVTSYFSAFEVTKDDVDKLISAGAKVTFFDLLRMALKVVFDNFTGFKAGFMISHAQGTGSSCAGPQAAGVKCTNGAYVLTGVADMADPAAEEKFHQNLTNLQTPGGSLNHSYQLKELEFEMYRYFKGWNWYNAFNGYQDYASDSTRNLGDNADKTNNSHLLAPDADAISGSAYISPLKGTSCTKLFAINFIFGVTNQEDNSDAAIKKAADSTNQGMGLTALANGTNGAIQMVSYMKGNDLDADVAGTQSVTQYFVTDASSTSIKSLAAAGGTSVVTIGSDPAAVVAALEAILQEILSVSTTFVSASVPVNVFNRSESLDNVFIALFQANEDKHPFWVGNVKKLKLDLSTEDGEDVVTLIDASDPVQAAIANDGRIEHEALTYWTRYKDLPAPDTANDEVEGADGRAVARGAAGHRIPGFIDGKTGLENGDGIRQMFYDPDATSGSLLDLDATATVAGDVDDDLGTDATTALSMLQWLRGYDSNDEDGDGVTDEVRAWLFGDPLHSRPLPVSYGKTDGHTSVDNPLIYVAVGSNDGTMRYIRNSVASGSDIDDDAGEEAWAFVPRAVMPAVNTLWTYHSKPVDHPYGVDGPATSLTIDKNSDGTVDWDNPTAALRDEVYLYFGLRRGGRAIYALNVSNPTEPSLAWRIDSSQTDFTDLGYTFSPPKVGKINLGKGDLNIVAFAGGYDLDKDTRTTDVTTGDQKSPASGTVDDIGATFYVVNATTGELIFKAKYGATKALSGDTYTHPNLTDSIPSEIALLDADGDGYTDRAVFGDTGGQIWRVDMGSPSATEDGVENWRITLLGTVGRHFNDDINDDRRFFHRPDVVPSKDTVGNFDAVVIGSGDRENPLDRSVSHGGDSTYLATTNNFVYMIKDRQISPYVKADSHPTPIDHDDLGDITDNCPADESCSSDLVTYLQNGWRMQLAVGPGEKSLSSPLTVTNTVFFTTYLPLGTQADVTTTVDGEIVTCGPQEGKGLLYAVNLADATPVTNFNVSRDSVESDRSDAADRYSELASAGIPADVVALSLGGQTYVLPPDLKPSDVEASTRWRTFWYQVDDDDGP